MSISAPEAHHTHLPDKVVDGADRYADEHANIATLGNDEVDATIQALEAERAEARERAADRLRAARPGELQLARTAIVVNMAGELLQHAHNQEATPESRRLAIELASSAMGRHYANIASQRGIARRHM
ncbi:MAG TPA: hypothetical protein VJM46_01270 [Candidatus Saccharimonadales bacterium]|nr:hypothetical protein [Candidatus Saccharimonadales bacterium]